jgi:sugar phosphate isomerase/epimerase
MTLSMPTIDWVKFPSEEGQLPQATASLEALLDAAVEAGFVRVGLDSFTLARPDAPADVPAALASRGLSCTDVGVLVVGSGDGLEQAHQLGALAQSVGAGVCVTVVDVEPDDLVIERLRACAEVLRGYGARMALEFLPYGPLATLPDTIAVCEAVGWANCGVLLDTWHFFNSGEPWDVLAAMSGDQIAFVQVNDAPEPISDDMQYESRFRRAYMGQGRFNLPEFVQAVRATGYNGVVSPEVLSADLVTQDPRDVAQGLASSLHAMGW